MDNSKLNYREFIANARKKLNQHQKLRASITKDIFKLEALTEVHVTKNANPEVNGTVRVKVGHDIVILSEPAYRELVAPEVSLICENLQKFTAAVDNAMAAVL